MDFKTTKLHEHNKHIDGAHYIWIPATDFHQYVAAGTITPQGYPHIPLATGADVSLHTTHGINDRFFEEVFMTNADLAHMRLALSCDNGLFGPGDARMGIAVVPFLDGTDVSAPGFVPAYTIHPIPNSLNNQIIMETSLIPAAAFAATLVDSEGVFLQIDRNGIHIEDTYGGSVYFYGVWLIVGGIL